MSLPVGRGYPPIGTRDGLRSALIPALASSTW